MQHSPALQGSGSSRKSSDTEDHESPSTGDGSRSASRGGGTRSLGGSRPESGGMNLHHMNGGRLPSHLSSSHSVQPPSMARYHSSSGGHEVGSETGMSAFHSVALFLIKFDRLIIRRTLELLRKICSMILQISGLTFNKSIANLLSNLIYLVRCFGSTVFQDQSHSAS